MFGVTMHMNEVGLIVLMHLYKSNMFDEQINSY